MERWKVSRDSFGVLNLCTRWIHADGKADTWFRRGHRVDLSKNLGRAPTEEPRHLHDKPGVVYFIKTCSLRGGGGGGGGGIRKSFRRRRGHSRLRRRTGRIAMVLHTIPPGGVRVRESWPTDAWKNERRRNNWALSLWGVGGGGGRPLVLVERDCPISALRRSFSTHHRWATSVPEPLPVRNRVRGPSQFAAGVDERELSPGAPEAFPAGSRPPAMTGA